MQINQQLQNAAIHWWWDYLDHIVDESKSDVLITVRTEEQQTS